MILIYIMNVIKIKKIISAPKYMSALIIFFYLNENPKQPLIIFPSLFLMIISPKTQI